MLVSQVSKLLAIRVLRPDTQNYLRIPYLMKINSQQRKLQRVAYLDMYIHIIEYII